MEKVLKQMENLSGPHRERVRARARDRAKLIGTETEWLTENTGSPPPYGQLIKTVSPYTLVRQIDAKLELTK